VPRGSPRGGSRAASLHGSLGAAEGWLLPGLVDADPRTDLSVLDRPRAVILRGRLMRAG
jgi:hypothetical protein